jgi:exodeoxyribonuclease V alpha subunit
MSHSLLPLSPLFQALRTWTDTGWLRELDAAFADFVAPAGVGLDPLVHLAAALLSHQVGRGQVRLDLAATLADPNGALDLPPQDARGRERIPATEHSPPPLLPAEVLASLTLPAWRAALQAHPAVDDVDDVDGKGVGDGSTPLVLADGCLLLRRHWRCEQTLQQALAQRLLEPPLQGHALTGQRAGDDAALRQALDALFPTAPSGQSTQDGSSPDWQKIACALAARHAFAIITGGPGTGKTTTVVKLLVVLQHLALQQPAPRPLRIRLAAPTGKAAARLAESVAAARGKLALGGLRELGGPEGLGGLPVGAALLDHLPGEVSTLHRLLGVKPGSRHFRHDAQQKLPLDVLVVDEASMVDLEMMAAVLEALPRQARLVLLGDKDQLASVEAGAVLGLWCQRADGGHYTPATRAWLQEVSGQDVGDPMTDPAGQATDQAIVKLRKSHRFGEASGIGRLAQAVHAGEAAWAQALLTKGLPDIGLAKDLGCLPAGWRVLFDLLHQTGPWSEECDASDASDASQAAPARHDAWARQVLKAAGRFQVLCAVRGGPQGVEAVNRRIAQALAAEGLIPGAEGWFVGRPVMVTRNDYGLGLMNGDVGVTLHGPPGASSAPSLRVAFPDGRGGIRWVPPSRLRDVETAFAITVHKSQGSEFDHVALVLPGHMSAVVTRELVYTAITRARVKFTLVVPDGGDEVLQQAVQRTAPGTAGARRSAHIPGLQVA